jgi:hypothetical protein
VQSLHRHMRHIWLPENNNTFAGSRMEFRRVATPTDS